MYNLGNNTANFNSSASYIDVGIHENVEATEVKYSVTDKGNKFIAITYTDENGNHVTRTEWEPKGDNPEALTGKVATQMARLEQFLFTFIAPGTKINATGFDDFAKKFIQVLGTSYKGVKVRIKVVYDRKNWTSTPEYGKYAWIEPMTIPKEKSKIRPLTIDKLTRTEAPIMRKKDGSDTNTTSTSPKSEGDLPF
jgi:hypothetical protein